MIFAGVDKLRKEIDNIVIKNIENHYHLVVDDKNNAMLIKCLQIIHREKKIYDSV
jgi:hypothetical protein